MRRLVIVETFCGGSLAHKSVVPVPRVPFSRLLPVMAVVTSRVLAALAAGLVTHGDDGWFESRREALGGDPRRAWLPVMLG